MKLVASLVLRTSGSGRRGARRAIGRVACLAVALGALGGVAATSCSHEARPVVQPDEAPPVPPLPPGSGTPIGYLVDAPELKLTDEQLGKLKVIDDELATRFAYLDSVQRSASTASGAEPPQSSRGGVGFGASGQRTGTSGDRITPPAHLQGDTGGAGGAGAGVGSPRGSTADERADTLKRLPDARAHDVRAAVARALAVLGPEQQEIAKKVLRDRGVDPETGRFEATGEPGPGRASGSDVGSGGH